MIKRVTQTVIFNEAADHRAARIWGVTHRFGDGHHFRAVLLNAHDKGLHPMMDQGVRSMASSSLSELGNRVLLPS